MRASTLEDILPREPEAPINAEMSQETITKALLFSFIVHLRFGVSEAVVAITNFDAQNKCEMRIWGNVVFNSCINIAIAIGTYIAYHKHSHIANIDNIDGYTKYTDRAKNISALFTVLVFIWSCISIFGAKNNCVEYPHVRNMVWAEVIVMFITVGIIVFGLCCGVFLMCLLKKSKKDVVPPTLIYPQIVNVV